MKQKGFTLIELLIVLALMSILTAVAFPHYNGYVQLTRRADAKAALAALANAMERNYSLNGNYDGLADGGGAPLPRVFVPPDSLKQHYDITIVANDSTFTISAVPKGSQVHDTCGTLTMNEVGGTTPATGCW